MQELLNLLEEINQLFVHTHDIVISGSTGTQTIPVISSTVDDVSSLGSCGGEGTCLLHLTPCRV